MTTSTPTLQRETDRRELAVVASFDDYAAAERAVDQLADEGFPVAHLRVVGEGLRFVEDVTGRRDPDRVAYEGAVSGAIIAGFLGLLFGLLNWLEPLISALLLGVYGVVFGAALGAILGLIAHATARGARDFSSVRSISAERYDVLAEADVADEARARIAGAGEGR
jgi:hypothetical protein